VWREEGVYSRIKEVLDGMAQEPSRADGTGIYPWQSSARTLRIVLGHRCVGEFEARRAADELGDRIDRKTLEDWWLQPESMLASIYAFTGKGEADVRKALDLLTPDKRAAAPNLQEAKTLFQKAFASDDNERSREFCRVRLTEVDGLLAFGAGKPYERKFDPELIGWLAERGVWKRESDDAVVGHARGVPSPVLLVPVLSPVLPLDVEFDIEAIRPTNANLTLGLLMPQQGSPVAGMQGPARFALIPRQKLAVSEVAGKFRAFPCALKDVNRLRVRIADGRAMPGSSRARISSFAGPDPRLPEPAAPRDRDPCAACAVPQVGAPQGRPGRDATWKWETRVASLAESAQGVTAGQAACRARRSLLRSREVNDPRL
jgi:hypothetical protein